MKILDLFNTAVKALNANKARSFLTMLGVIIGVFAVVSLVALGQGVQNYITDEFEKIGSNLLFVSPGSGDFSGDPATSYTRNKLDEIHIDLIEQHAGDFISTIIPFYVSAENLEFKTKTFLGEIIGINYEGVGAFSYVLEHGRGFSKSEEKAKAKVLILGPEVATELFGRAESSVGQKVKMGSETFEIVGVFEERGSNYDDGVLMPYTTMRANFDLDKFSSIVVQVDDAESVPLAMRQVELALLRDLDEEEFEVMNSADILGTINEIFGALTLGLGAIAGISLLVGGSGIMNIMLVSVTERTREIGLRKAVGATPTVIMLQFLVESILLSVVGGVIGLAFGALLTLGAQQWIRAEMTPGAIAMAFIFSVAVGVLFGTYPAMSAAKRDAIEALRYE